MPGLYLLLYPGERQHTSIYFCYLISFRTGPTLLSYCYLPTALLLLMHRPAVTCPLPCCCLYTALLLPVHCPATTCPPPYCYLSTALLLLIHCPAATCPLPCCYLSTALPTLAAYTAHSYSAPADGPGANPRSSSRQSWS